ncbi:MAG: Na+/H+ antiporter [Candidatus Acidiferrales bacterium]
MIQSGGIQAVEIVFLVLLFFVVIFAALARKLQTPYPIVLVVAGLLLSLIPGIPKIALDPNVIFLVVLPPLLYSAAWLTSWREFKFNLVSILLLAFGLVSFTVLGVAEAARSGFPGFDWRLGFVLGAVVATTDAIAATSIAKRIGLPQRIVDILEGESLVNDATGLLALEFAIAMLVSGQTPSVASGALRLIYLIVVGLAIGLVVGSIVLWFERRIDDGPIEIVVSILTPYATYLAAEAVHASGVLAVVACGLYLSRRSSQFFSATVRLQTGAVWGSLTFAINGLVFVLIGLQLPQVLAGIREYSFPQLLFYGALFSVIVIVLRLLWMYPGAYLSYLIRTRLLHQNYSMPSGKQLFVIGWTGMRGVLALAAAMSLPEALADGKPFPERNLIVFLTFCVILVTLVLQGLTLPALIRALGLAGAPVNNAEEDEARRIIANTALTHLQGARESDLADFSAVYDDISQRYARRLASLTKETDGGEAMSDRQLERYRALLGELMRVERKTAVRLRNEGRINDEVLRKLEHELDLSETRLALS